MREKRRKKREKEKRERKRSGRKAEPFQIESRKTHFAKK